MRWTNADASRPAFFLLSTNWAKTGNCPPLVSELDIFERLDSTSTRGHNGALHRNTTGPCRTPDEFNDNHWTDDAGVDLSAGFHTYSALWTTEEVIWYLDGRELKRWPVYDSTDQRMFLIISSGAGGRTWDRDAAIPVELRTEVDWVRVWQR